MPGAAAAVLYFDCICRKADIRQNGQVGLVSNSEVVASFDRLVSAAGCCQ